MNTGSFGISQDSGEIIDKLKEAERKYRTLIEQSPDGILIIDLQGTILEFNAAAHLQLDYSREEFQGLRISDIDPFQSPEEIRASIRHVLKEGIATFEVRHRAKGGEIRNVKVITQVITLSGQQAFHTIWRDITEEKLAKERLREMVEKAVEEKELLVRERDKELTAIEGKLGDILPVCSHCRRVRDCEDSWHDMATYLSQCSGIHFSHGLCPDCARKHYPKYYEES